MQVNPSGADDNELVAPNVGNMARHAIVMKSHLQHHTYKNACKNNASERFVMQNRSHGRATIHRLNHVLHASERHLSRRIHLVGGSLFIICMIFCTQWSMVYYSAHIGATSDSQQERERGSSFASYFARIGAVSELCDSPHGRITIPFLHVS